MHKRLSARQQQVLDFIVDSIRDRGMPPTLREIAAHIGISSTNGVSDHLKALERKGYVDRNPLLSRGTLPTPTYQPRPESRAVLVPILRTVCR